VTPRLETLRNQLSAIIHTEISTNIHGLLWGKLTWNATVNGLGAVAGHTFGELVSTDLGRDLTLRGYTEVIDVARALGVEVVPEVVGPTTALHLPSGADAGARRQRYDVLHAMTETFAAVYPSSLQSLERGRPTETAFLNGHVVAKAQIVGVEVPLNTALIDMIAEIERGEREITPANLHDLAAYR
ncbi:MAG: ketopantoate reductase C-terminal domain-containing protein, partial [Chloroflexota bacterium]